MRGHGLRVLQRAAIAKIGGDPGCAEGMVADPHSDAGGRQRAGRAIGLMTAASWSSGSGMGPALPQIFLVDKDDIIR